MAKKTGGHVKHIPHRTCVSCRDVLAKRELIRLVRTEKGVRVDPTGKLKGRGAYLHASRDCWEKGIKGSLANALRITLSDEDKRVLLEYFKSLSAESDKGVAQQEN